MDPRFTKGMEPHYFNHLLHAARDGSANAFDELMQECRAYLLSIADQELQSNLGPKAGASDIVQQTMLSAHRCMGGFGGQGRDEFLAWLRGILINDIKDVRRRYRTAQRDIGRELVMSERDEGQFTSNELTPASDAIAREEAERLRQALERLSTDDREVLELRNWQQLPFAEIGDQIGRSAEAARKLWSRAIVRLQTEIGKLR